MTDIGRRLGVPARLVGWACGGALAAILLADVARATEPPAFEARGGLDLATAAAQSWAQDATLMYLENDDDLDAAGKTPRWGYLFYSPTADKARAYSVRNGKILAAENLDMKFVAPPVESGWIDSGAAYVAAENQVGREFCQKHAGRLATMLLMRGAFDAENPNRTTWLLVYTTPDAPSLFVVVDAADGKVRRTWRG